MSNELIPVNIDEFTPAALFRDGGLESLLKDIETEARSVVPDASSEKGRKAIASNAYKVSRSKTYLDTLGKDFVAGLKQQAKAVDEQRSMLRNRLDALRDEVRRPLTEIEEAEKAHEDSIKEAIAEMANKAAMPGSIEDLRVRLEELESVKIDISFSRWINDAAAAKAAGIQALTDAIYAAEEDERLRSEAARKAEADRIEREHRIAAEAAERATREAEARAAQQAAEAAAKAQAEQRRVERERLEADHRAKEAEKKAAEAAERATREAEARAAQQAAEAAAKAQAEQRRVERERLEADHRAKEAEKKAAEAAERERARIDAERRAAEHEEKRKREFEARRSDIESEIHSFLKAAIGNACATVVVKLLVAGKLPNVSITYR